MESRAYHVIYKTIEVGALGLFTPQSIGALIDLLPTAHIKRALLILVKAWLMAVTASQKIFASHSPEDWNTTRPLFV